MSRVAETGRLPVLALQRAPAARALGMSVEHFDRHVRADLPVVYSGRLRLYPVVGLQRWLDDRTVDDPATRCRT